MRLPWIQVAEEAWGISRELAGLLPRVKPQQARGLLLDLWAWGLSLGPEDQIPDGVVRHPRAVARMAGAVEWTRDPEELAAALEAVGVIDRLPDGIRVRGMGRYASTWKKNRGGSSRTPDEPETHPHAHRTEAERNPRGSRTGPVGKPNGTEAQDVELDGDGDSTKTLSPAAGAAPEPQLPLDGLPAGAGRVPAEDSGVEQVKTAWNAVATRRQLPTWRETGQARRTAIRRAIRARGVSGCLALVEAVDRSPFLRGERTDFRANPDWLFAPKNAEKVSSGNYEDSGVQPAQAQAPPPRLEPRDEAERLWFEVIDQVRDFEKPEIARQLEVGDLRARIEGSALVMAQGKKLYMSWVRSEYGGLLREAAAAKGINLVLEDEHADEDAEGRADQEAAPGARAASG